MNEQHYGPESWNKNWIYRGDDWLYNTRWDMLVGQRSQVDIAQIITWNGTVHLHLFTLIASYTLLTDYGESSYIGPIEGDQPNSQAWTNQFTHDGWLKMTRYYATAFKTGAYPTIAEDNVYIWSRPHSKDAWAADYVGRPRNADWVRT
jgi:glucan endo-1,3-alpha-glucosidase